MKIYTHEELTALRVIAQKFVKTVDDMSREVTEQDEEGAMMARLATFALERVEADLRRGEPTVPTRACVDDVHVGIFAEVMRDKLAKKRKQGFEGWLDASVCSVETLAKRLVECVFKGDPVDVANYAMMLNRRGVSDLTLRYAIHERIQVERLHVAEEHKTRIDRLNEKLGRVQDELAEAREALRAVKI
jgi:hypothetical protein